MEILGSPPAKAALRVVRSTTIVLLINGKKNSASSAKKHVAHRHVSHEQSIFVSSSIQHFRCYWVECENGISDENATMTMMMTEQTTEATPPSCDAEVKECPNGVFVAKAPELNCDFYPCPEGDVAISEASPDTDILSGWGSTPLSHSCSSDGSGSCGLCQGDCGSDVDCNEGLLCYSRGQGEMTAVPGCVSGGEGDLPGMDYCYSPFPPATTTVATTTATMVATTTMNAMDESYVTGELDFARECTESEPCGACEGDCDDDMQCANGLKCFSRVKGSVDSVPGCSGVGIDGESLLAIVSLLETRVCHL